MFTPKRLTVEGFRGFRDAQEFAFDKPATELFGDNRSGKSSALNALEWALFGDECAGKQTGIRERVGWVVPNKHLKQPGVRVKLELEGPYGVCVIVRALRRAPRKAALEETLELTLPAGTTLSGDDAREKLAGLLQASFRDFLTTVYQHQEAIRAVLTQEPKDRNDAIDRLLGLSDQRNLLVALDGADLRGRQKEVARDFTAFEEQIQAALATREHDILALRQEAEEAGLTRSRLTGAAALRAARSVTEALKKFAEEAGLEPHAVEVPDDWPGLADFDKSTKKAIGELRGQVPGIEEQKKLLARRQPLLATKAAFETVRHQLAELGAKCRELDKEHGGSKGVSLRIAEAVEKLEAEQDALRKTSGQAAVVNEALAFLATVGDDEPPCPVCGTAVAGLGDKLKDLWATKLKNLVERITGKIEALKARLKDLRGVAAAYQKLNEEAERLLEQQATLRAKTAELLGVDVGDGNDPLALILAELKRVDFRLTQLSEAIQERQERLDAIERDLGLVRLVREYLHLEEKKQVLESIQESAAFKQMEAIRDQMAGLVEDVEAIESAVAEVAREEAATQLTAAGTTIDRYFRQLSRNPAVQELKLAITADKRTRRNHYDITDQDGKDLTPILSQGDLNALALAIFLGLAVTAKEDSTFRFLMLDDPSQSLGTEHKKHLADLLDEVAQHKRLILATMDVEFHECLKAGFTKAKREYRFGKWTPEEGPSVTTTDDFSDKNPGARRPAKRRPEPAAR